MKATIAPPHRVDAQRKTLVTAMALSAAIHGVVLLGVISSVWLGEDKPRASHSAFYRVSLVDAPSTLRALPSSRQRSEPVVGSAAPLPAASLREPAAAPVRVVPQPPVSQPAPAAPKPQAETPPPKPTVAQPPVPQPAPVPPQPRIVSPAPVAPPKPPTPQAAGGALKPPTRQPTPVPPPHRDAVATPSPTSSVPPDDSPALRAQQAMARLRTQQADQEAAQQRVAQRLAALRARVGSAERAHAAAGVATGLQTIRLQAYQARVRQRIIDAWILPLPKKVVQSLQATALLTIDRSGQVTQLSLLQPSGNALFDDSLLRAIRRASPLPGVPEDYPGQALEVEMRFKAL